MGTEVANEDLQILKKYSEDWNKKFYSYLEYHLIIPFCLVKLFWFFQTFTETEHHRDGEAALISQQSTDSFTVQQENTFQVVFIRRMIWVERDL